MSKFKELLEELLRGPLGEPFRKLEAEAVEKRVREFSKFDLKNLGEEGFRKTNLKTELEDRKELERLALYGGLDFDRSVERGMELMERMVERGVKRELRNGKQD